VAVSDQRAGGDAMKPVHFQEANKILGKPESMTDDECGALSVFNDGQICISCWKPSWKERFSILFYGRIWLSVYSGFTQPPVAIEGTNQIFVKAENEETSSHPRNS
jgi:hypothetical protein